jgi:autotransporter-associated beta strand protein
MKTFLKQVPSLQFPHVLSRRTMTFAALLAVAGVAITAHAQAPVVKANSYTSLTTGSDWVGGTAPGANNIAVWNSTASSPVPEPLGASTTWEGIQIVNPGSTITISGDGNSLTNGAVGVVGLNGIDMSSASQNLTLSNNLVVSGVQNWKIASGRTLTVNGLLSRNAGSAVRIYLADPTSLVLTTNGSAAVSLTASPNAILGSTYGNIFFSTLNDTDYVAEIVNGSGFEVVPGVTTGVYTPNPSGATPTDAGSVVLVDFNNQGSYGIRLGNTRSYNGVRFNMPQTNTAMVFNGAPAWEINIPSGRTMTCNSILVTTNVGNSPVLINNGGFTGGTTGFTRIGNGGTQDLLIFQNNPAAPLIFQPNMSISQQGTGSVTKLGAGLVQLQLGSAYTGGTRIYEGILEIDGSGTVGTNTLNVYGGTFAQGNSATNSAPVIFFSGTTNIISVNAANGQCRDASTVTFNGGNTIQFLYSNTISPSATTAALLSTNLNGLTLNSPVNISVLSGNFAVGQFPLVKYNGTVGGSGYSAISSLTLPPHIFGYLSNNVVNSSIDVVITNVDLPLIWNAASGSAWDIATTANWLDQIGNASTYQQLGSLGDSVLFSDAAPGPSITVALNTNVVPASVTVSNANNTYTISGTGGINGLGSLTKTDSGTLTLSTSNSFTGGLNLNGGTIIFSSLTNLGGANINFNGGTLQYNGNSDDISVRTVNFTGGATINTAGQNVNYASPVGNGGAGGLTKTGSGTLTLNGTNTYHGNTVVAQGTLALGAGTYLTNSASITLNSGTVLDAAISGVNLLLSPTVSQSLVGVGQVNGVVTVLASTTINPGGTGLTGTLAVNGGLTINGGTMDIDVAPTSNDLIAVTGPLTLTGGAVQLNLIGTVPLGRYVIITYTGALTGGVGSIPPPQISQPNTIATLDDSVPGQIAIVLAQSASDVLTWPGTGSTWDTTTADWLNGANPWIYTNGDKVTFNDSETGGNVSPSLTASVLPSMITVSNTVVPVYTFQNGGGAIGGNASLVKDGTGTLVMDTPNSYFGTTTIKNGTLQIGNGSLGDIGRGNVTNNGALLFQEGDNGSHFVGGAISGTGSLTVNAAGCSVILTNNNTYSGLTTISNGTLEVGFGGPLGSLGSNNAVTNNGALLLNRSGSVTLTANVTGSGSLEDSGPATLTLSGALSYLGDSSFSNGVVKITAANQLPNETTVAGSTGILNLDGGPGGAAILDISGFNLTVNGLSGAYNAFNSSITNSTATAKTNVLTVMNTIATTYNGQIMDRGVSTAGRTELFLTASTNSLTLNPTNANNFGGGIIVSNSTLSLGTPGASGVVNINESQLAPGSGPITLLGTNAELIVDGYTGSTTPTYTPLTNTLVVPAGQNVSLATPQRGDVNSTLLGGGVLNYLANYVRGGVGGNWAGFTGQIIMNGNSSGGNIGFGDTNANQIGLPNATVIMITNVAFHPGSLTFGGVAYPATTIFPIGALSGGDSSDSITGTEAGNNSGSANAVLTIGGLNTNCTYTGGIVDGQALTKVGTAIFTLNCGGVLVTSTVPTFPTPTIVIGYETNIVSYTGVTTVSNGVLALDAPVNLTNSTNVVIASPAAILDASDMGYVSNLTTTLPNGATQELVIDSIFETVTNQSLGGVGTLNGFLQADQGSIFNVGLPTGTFNVTSNASLSGIVNISLDSTDAPTCGKLAAPSITINPTATLVVTNIGPGITNGVSFTLFNNPVSGFASVTLPAKDPTGTTNYIWQNFLAVNGTITLTNGGLVVTPASPAKFTSISVSGVALTITGTNGAANGTYRLLESTNLLLPVNQWTPVLTNSFDGSGNFNLTTNVVTPGSRQMFYLLLMP